MVKTRGQEQGGENKGATKGGLQQMGKNEGQDPVVQGPCSVLYLQVNGGKQC